MADTVDLTDDPIEDSLSDAVTVAANKLDSKVQGSLDEIDLTEDSPRDQPNIAPDTKSRQAAMKSEDDYHRKRIMAFASSVSTKRQRIEAESIAPALAAVTINSSDSSPNPVRKRARRGDAPAPTQPTIPAPSPTIPASLPASIPAPASAASEQVPAVDEGVPAGNRLLAQLHAERVARQKAREAAAAATASGAGPSDSQMGPPPRVVPSDAGIAAAGTHRNQQAGPSSSAPGPAPNPAADRGKAKMQVANGHIPALRANGPAAPVSRQPGTQEQSNAEFDLLTYNVWFSEDAINVRMKAIGDIIQSLNHPCFVCLQEVTPFILGLLSSMPFWQHYTASPVEHAQYFTMLLVHKDKVSGPTRFFYHEFHNSLMGRGLLGCHCKVGGTDVCVSTVHLESPCNGQTFAEPRREQLVRSLELLGQQPAPNALLAGDTNWNTKDGDMPLTPGWGDAWTNRHPGQLGWTYNCRENAMLMGTWPPQRFDRILFKMSNWEAQSVEIVGNQPLPNKYYNKKLRNGTSRRMPVLPSDHYGLIAKFKRKVL